MRNARRSGDDLRSAGDPAPTCQATNAHEGQVELGNLVIPGARTHHQRSNRYGSNGSGRPIDGEMAPGDPDNANCRYADASNGYRRPVHRCFGRLHSMARDPAAASCKTVFAVIVRPIGMRRVHDPMIAMNGRCRHVVVVVMHVRVGRRFDVRRSGQSEADGKSRGRHHRETENQITNEP